MHVLLLHNPKAAAGRLSKTTLMRAFERAGHTVRYVSIQTPGWKRGIDKERGVVVAAGGDGAIGRIAIAIARRRGSEIPLAVIPAGTANNIARALDLPRSVAAVAASLERARSTRLAICIVRSPWGKARFVESAGVGPFAELMATVLPTRRAAIAFLRRTLLKAPGRTLTVKADGRDLSGDYLMVQVLNIGAIGPRLEVARNADPGDERLELLLVRERDRIAFAKYLAARAAGRPARCPVTTIRARRIEIGSWPARDGGHVDDRPWPEERRPARGTVKIEVKTRIRVARPQ